MYSIIKSLLFLWPAERAHYMTMKVFKWALFIPGFKSFFRVQGQALEVDGLEFKNGVGMAAGFDKDGSFIPQLEALNFGFVEIGTVTPLPQRGNPAPRLFRLPKDRALINRMGFNNEGIHRLKWRLTLWRKKNPGSAMKIGVNIGKNKTTPNQDAWSDYKKCYEEVYHLADFFVVNVSSPNTPNLRELQGKDELRKIISVLLEFRKLQPISRPLYLKIAPDLSEAQLHEIIDLRDELGFEGLVATNTTIDRSAIKETHTKLLEQIGNGGLSGSPLLRQSNSFVKQIRDASDMTIIGVGGIDSVQTGLEKVKAGADLIEIYTGLIYSGPGLIKKLILALKT